VMQPAWVPVLEAAKRICELPRMSCGGPVRSGLKRSTRQGNNVVLDRFDQKQPLQF